MKFDGDPFVHDGRIATPLADGGYLLEDPTGGLFDRVEQLP